MSYNLSKIMNFIKDAVRRYCVDESVHFNDEKPRTRQYYQTKGEYIEYHGDKLI